MNKIILSIFIVSALVVGINTTFASGGFDKLGYNNDARIFNGLADGVDKVLDGTVWGDATYANDRVVMKWNNAWDNCNANRTPENCKGAWIDNEWNGSPKGGSGEVCHYKIVWVGDYSTNPELIPTGAEPIWNEYAVISDHCRIAEYGHVWFTIHVTPAGYGAY